MARKIDVVFSDIEPGLALQAALARTPGEVIDVIKASHLRGRGGAGFPTGLKWEAARAAQETIPGASGGSGRVMVCNADEGEPGTFKDKKILENQASKVIEGMLIGGYAIGAGRGFIYLRGEYKFLVEPIQARIEEWRERQQVLRPVDCPSPRMEIEIRLGSGAYVCGEETALLESMEGHRGEPRNKPPFPTQRGFLRRPTVVNNVETLSLVPHILIHGASWFLELGTAASAGSKLFSVSGDCGRPGIYEFEFGVTIRQLLEEVGAGADTKAVQIGGASGFCACADDFDKPLCFEGIPTGGSIIIFNASRDMFRVLKNFVAFFQEESCGQCVPCREGCSRMLEGIEKFEQGKGSSRIIRDLLELSNTMSLASKCGFGQSVPNSFRTIASKFRDEILSAGGGGPWPT